MNAREAAEKERFDPANWKFGVLYSSRADPRVVVRNRRLLGWTWNFGHRATYLYLLVVSALFIAPTILAHRVAGATGTGVLLVTLATIAVAMLWARHVASGPR